MRARGAARPGAVTEALRAGGLAFALLCGHGACDSQAGPGSAVTLAVAADDPFQGEPLAEFELRSHTGRAVRKADLLGQPCVLDFIFTTCTGPCPRVSGQMRSVQALLRGVPARLVSFSVDPEIDTLEVLSAYAARFEADAERWWFLTGPEQQIDGVLRSLWLARAKDAGAALGMQVTHSTRLIVLDARGVVRGHYDGETDEGARAAAARAQWLAENPGR